MGDERLELGVRVGVSMEREVSEAPVSVSSTLKEATALVKRPAWVRTSYVCVITGLNCFEIVRKHLIEGFPTVEIARLIQSLGELTEHDLSFIEMCLKHYRVMIPKGEMLALRVPIKPIEDKLKKRVDVRDDLEKLKNWMMERIEIAVNREKSFNMLLPNTEKSFGVALEIMSKIHEIQEKEIGNVEDVKQQAQSWTRTDFDAAYGKPGLNDTLKNPVSRMKIARFLDQTMNLVGGMDDTQRERVLEAAKKQVEGEALPAPPVSKE